VPSRLQDLYAVLELKHGASMDEVRLAYRHLAKQWDPDRFPDDPAKQREARDHFDRIEAAYEEISELSSVQCDSGALNAQVQTSPSPGRGLERSSAKAHRSRFIQAGMALVLLLVLSALLFPPQPSSNPVSGEAPGETAAGEAKPARTLDTAASSETVSAGAALPWTIIVEPPSAPLSEAGKPAKPPGASNSITPQDVTQVIWVPASDDAAAKGMSWSLNPPGLRPRAVPSAPPSPCAP